MEQGASRGAREGEAEVRKIHVVYYLSRNGKTEPPHLFRVHHSTRNGVHLRDVKRWLSELRGKEMPESFSWSYKRFLQDSKFDLLMKIRDLFLSTFTSQQIKKTVFETAGSTKRVTYAQNKTAEDYFQIKQHVEAGEEEEEEKEVRIAASITTQETLEIDDTISPKPPSSGDESPIKPAISASGFEENRAMEVKWKKEMKREVEKSGNEVAIKKSGIKAGKRRSGKGRSEEGRRRRKVDVLRSIFKCKLVETKDSAVRLSRERNGSLSQSNRRSTDTVGERQCGKSFKPEKLHSHMKSCVALKEKGRNRSFSRAAAGSTRRPSKVTVTVL
ncbi:hypothetical protein KSP39_PZI005132 [Platanthera zijinensis]|uniref:SOSEKI DIX-like domain-containing protein n=1 Tax=Platanthera zijinensis TaxID=2320716 RepID=A0AAP0BTC1_9ASPA